MKQRQATPTKNWKDITDDHKKTREVVEQKISTVAEGGEADPLAVVGPYRCGKTQLLYHSFDFCWENGLPALYTDAKSIFKEFEKSESEDIAKWLSQRTTTQVQALIEGKDADWLPNWEREEDRLAWLKDVVNEGSFDENYAVLLVDEVEQAYTDLRSKDLVDDENPLRIILDDTEGVYQLWAFGLVSAYEFLGEADYARFREVRIPLLDVEDVQRNLLNNGKNADLANGIWWLARGRVGWSNKLIEEAPSTDEDISAWVQWVSSLDFEGTSPLNKDVWTNSDVDRGQWDNARKAILFLKNEYPDWEIQSPSGDSISVDNMKGLSLDIILNISSVDAPPASKEMVERNLNRLCDSLSTKSSWKESTHYLPANMLTENKSVGGFLKLLQDLITSFEPRGSIRAKANEIVEEVSTNEFRVSWSDRFYNNIDSEHGAWSIRPSIVSEAYPSVAVNPNQLTKTATNELRDNIHTGIEIDPNIDSGHIGYEVYFCPNIDSVNSVIEKAAKPRDIQKTYCIIIPDLDLADVDNSEKLTQLIEVQRIQVITETASRLWDFLIQLRVYLEDNFGIEQPVTQNKINNALDSEPDRENRNTIQTLFDQVYNISESAVNDCLDDFRQHYSRRDTNTPVWAESHLDEEAPPGMYGGGSLPRRGLSFALVCSVADIDTNHSYIDLRKELLNGIDEGYIEASGQEFGFQQFLTYVFSETGYSDPVRSTRKLYVSSQEGRDPSIDHLQEYLLSLSEMSEELDILTDMGAESDAIDIINGTRLRAHLGPEFLWGTYLDGSSTQNSEKVIEKLETQISQLEDLASRLENVSKKIQTKNEILTPPSGYGSPVEIKYDKIKNKTEHIRTVGRDVRDLRTRCESNSQLATIGIVFNTILNAYINQIESSVNTVEGAILGTELYSVENLKGKFSQLESRVNGSDIVNTHFNCSRNEIEEEIGDLGDEVFNFQGQVGADTIQPSDTETLSRISKKAEKDIDKVSELLDLFSTVDELETKQEEAQSELRESFIEFISTIRGGA
ncbi:hypothetical protein [Halobellus rarus]|uniref:ATP-binding protein n=1 Tax=Halobellus rarus TaxID=1126237 RepID=A0ABD6CMG1_9EURY|nr:hypothetical protein [Halobellus rarus]